MDVEGAERKVVKDWIDFGLTRNVQQIGMEFHSVDQFLREYQTIISGLYEQGFKVMAWEPNYGVALGPQKFHNNFEIFLRKTKTACQFVW